MVIVGFLSVLAATTPGCVRPVLAADNEISGTSGDDLLIGTPGTDRFFGGDGADVFVINYLSTVADAIVDFDPEEGDSLELTFDSPGNLPFKQENFSINRKGVVRIRIGARERDVARLNQTDLQLKLDSRKGRYFLRFSKNF